jgi:hypothetical protein
MTCEPAMAIDIGLLGQNDLVDQAAGSGVHRGTHGTFTQQIRS